MEMFNHQVVAKAGSFEYTRGELLELFNRVAPEDNWKNPIDKTLPGSLTDRELLGIIEAVVFFTGSRPTIGQEGGSFRVKAAGYYVATGA